jgi:hypothetical protein
MECVHGAEREVLRPLAQLRRILSESRRAPLPARACSSAVLLLPALVCIAQYFRIFPSVRLHGIQNAQIVLFVHADHVNFGQFLLVIIDSEPVVARFSDHGHCTHPERRSRNRLFTDVMFSGVLIDEVIDTGIRDGDRISLRRADDDGLLLITEGQDSIYRATLGVGDVDAMKGCFLSSTEDDERANQEKGRGRLVHGLESISKAQALQLCS